MLAKNYNPDVLSCLANLSNDEVFTPPKLANEMLDILPNELWRNPEAKFLDPVSKSGVFLREIAKRLDKGLKDQIPDKQDRANHILSNQLYGIAITELTSYISRRTVYCSKTANGEYSVCEEFDDESGNLLYKRMEHTWGNTKATKNKCIYCGASRKNYDRNKDLETYAYNFIHTEEPKKLFDMKFDVIIGNPPYQLSDGGHSRSSSPVYHKFIQQAKKLNPKYLTMIIPARWYAGGKGLDNFRSEMLKDNHIRKLVDFENSTNVFPGVDVAGGICYFLWDRDNKGLCEVTNNTKDGKVVSERSLDEFSLFIRHSQAVPIIRKVEKSENPKYFLDKVVTSRKPFGMPTNYKPSRNGIPCHFTQRIGLKYAKKEDVTDNYKILDKWKLLVPATPIAGQTDFSKPVGFYYEGNVKIAKPGECCTETWLVAYASNDKNKVHSFKSYLFTKIFRFLLLQAVVSQHVNKGKFRFVPHLDNYNKEYNDGILRKKWGITNEEWEFIDSRIKTIE